MKKNSNSNWLLTTMFLVLISGHAFSQANTSLSNLVSPTSVNQSLLPSATNSKSLGSATLAWKDAWFSGKVNIGGTSTPSAMLDITPPTTSSAGINLRPNAALAPSTTELRFTELAANGKNFVGFKAPSNISADKIWVLPAADGSDGQVLTTNGSGALSWVSPASGGSIGANTIYYIPKYDGTSLVTGSLKDSTNKISLGSSISSKGRFTSYRNSSLSGGGESAVQGIGNNSFLGETYCKGFLGAVDLNDLTSNILVPPFDFSHAGVLGYHTNSGSQGAGVVGYSRGTSVANYGIYGVADCGGFVDFGAVNTGVYGLAQKATFNYALRGKGTSEPGTTAYGLYASASGDGNNYAAYFANGRVYMQDWLQVSDSAYIDDVLVVGGGERPSAYEFAVTDGADAYVDDVLSVNTTNATAHINVKGVDETVHIEGTTPYIKMIDGANKPTFVQASGNNLRLGTLSGNNNGKMIFRFNGVDKSAMDVNGNLGIGTTSPSAQIHIKGTNARLRIEGTDAALSFFSGTTEKAFIQRQTDNLVIGTTVGDVTLGNNLTGTIVFVKSDGTVGIGTNSTSGYKLAVDGKVICEELKVQLSENWPDYVFADEYKLPALKDLEASIEANKHLPGIPSAKEINEEGINVGEMQKMMMQKIEELTLYVIDLQKQNDDLRSEVTGLKK